MISHKHKCVFIHIPKTGGMSIEKSFLKSLGLNFYNGECPPLLLSYNKNKQIGPLSLAHLSPEEYLEYSYLSPKLFNEYFKFSVVRNPYDRIISIYHHFGYHRVISFPDFMKHEFPVLQKTFYYFIKPQVEYLYDDNGNLLVDYIGRFEDILDVFPLIKQKVAHYLGELEHINKSSKKFKVLNRWNLRFIFKTLKRKPYLISCLNLRKNSASDRWDFFDKESLKIVNSFYEKDFENLGYQKKFSL